MDAAAGLWVCVTPDSDVYLEDLSPTSAEIDVVRVRALADVGLGRLPYGIGGGNVYDFQPAPTAAELDALVLEGQAEADAEKNARGLPILPWGAAVPGGGAAGPLVAAGDGAPPGGAGAGRPGGGVAAGAADAAVAAGAAGGGIPARFRPPVGLGAGVVVGADGGGARLPGVAGLAALVGAPGGGTAAAAAPAGLPAFPAAAGGADRVTATGLADGDGDLRTCAVRYDVHGKRYREFRAAVDLMEESQLEDFAVGGPRTALWVLRFMLEHGGTPRGWHARWKADGKLQPHDSGVAIHEACCLMLESAVCFDQLNAPNLATIELMVRQIQIVEEKWKERFAGAQDLGDVDSNLHLYMGLGAGVGSRAALCICPALSEHISKELQKEAAVSKERRKAREERQLAKPKKGANPG